PRSPPETVNARSRTAQEKAAARVPAHEEVTNMTTQRPYQRSKLRRLTLLASFVLLLSSSAAAFGGVAVGFGINVEFGPPVVPAAAEGIAPGRGPGHVWVAGHWGWYPGFGYRWARGAWLRPPFPHAFWVGPRFAGRVFYRGYWRRW